MKPKVPATYASLLQKTGAMFLVLAKHSTSPVFFSLYFYI